MTTEKLYFKATGCTQAIGKAKKYIDSFRYIAGGTDVIVNKFQGNDDAACLIDISGIGELKNVSVSVTRLAIGALVRLDDLKKHPAIKQYFPALLEAAHSVASPMIRKTATLGGNLLCENRCSFYNQSEWWREAVGHCLKCDGDVCIATGGKKNCFSKFVSDTAVVLISLDANIEVSGYLRSSQLPIESIYTGDGINPRNLEKTFLIKSIRIPINEGARTVYKKLRQRESLEFSSLTTAVTINKSGKVKIVLGGVDPKPIVVVGATKDDKNELIDQAIKKARIVDNDVYSREYRKEMIGVYLRRSFEELLNVK